ncbi:hypothetical protein ABPG75_004091 [Micractinium tetrahymenae]
MSMFNAKLGLGGLAGALGGSRQSLDPAAEIARLLNQHTHHWMAMEKEIKEVKAKQEGAQAAYAAAMTAREDARTRLVAAEAALAGVQAEAAHCRAELEASQASNGRLLEEVEALKAEVAGVTGEADQARQEFTDQVSQLMAELKQLQSAYPGSFFRAASAVAGAAATAQ